MENKDISQLIDELANAVKQNGDLSNFKKHEDLSSLSPLLSQLNQIPRTSIPSADLKRVRNQILHRISLKQSQTANTGRFGSFNLRMTAGIVGSFLIAVSLSAATAVAALQSVPGSALYPLKKVAESIELQLAPKDQRADLQIKFAKNRAEELQQVLEDKQSGKISDQEAEKIVTNTLKDLQNTTNAAVSATGKETKSTAIVDKINDISNKLKTASIQSEGQVKIELEKAVQSTQISQEQAIKNLEQAGLKVENPPITLNSLLKASGKLTVISKDFVSLGTAKFPLTEGTIYVNFKAEELETGQIVDIESEIKDNKSYALKITLVTKPQPESETNTESTESENTPDQQ